jgi:hypothetical protein
MFVPAFVFCALLEFTFVNYMWRKQPVEKVDGKKKSPEAVNGKAVAQSSEESDSAVAVTMVIISCRHYFFYDIYFIC